MFRLRFSDDRKSQGKISLKNLFLNQNKDGSVLSHHSGEVASRKKSAISPPYFEILFSIISDVSLLSFSFENSICFDHSARFTYWNEFFVCLNKNNILFPNKVSPGKNKFVASGLLGEVNSQVASEINFSELLLKR